MKYWRLHLCSPFNWLYKIFLSGIVVQLLSPCSSPPQWGLHYSMKNMCRMYFALIMFWRQLSPQLTIYFKATKTSVNNLCSVLHRLKSLYTPPLLRIGGCLEYLALHTLPNHQQCSECHHMLPPGAAFSPAENNSATANIPHPSQPHDWKPDLLRSSRSLCQSV